ncbi:MAG: hypothetical protein O7B99_06165 [Planctomycetota bacterium]|nr:hypothetical protein [Planctomycetota bacterium]
MSPNRKRILGVLAWFGLVALSVRPVGAAETVLSWALAPLRITAELASPLWLLRSPEVRAAEGEIYAAWDSEAAEGARLLELLARYATPDTPALRAGRRLVHAEVVGREDGHRDRLVVRLRDVRGVVPGLPVVCSDAYVGRVRSVAEEEGTAVVELVTSSTFFVGARTDDRETRTTIDMTVGGLDVGDRHTAQRGRVRLAVHNPSDRRLSGGLVRVHEFLQEIDRFAWLADGYRLGVVEREEGQERWSIAPELDFLDGLFHVVVLCPPDPRLPSAEPMPQALEDGDWLPARPLTHGDPAPWRRSVKLTRGSQHGVEVGAAVAFGARYVGRVVSVGPWSADVALLGDAGTSVVCIALFEGIDEPFVLGRLTALGVDHENGGHGGGAVVLAGNTVIEIPLEPDDRGGARRAKLFTGSDGAGIPAGLYLGEALVPVGGRRGERREVRLLDGARNHDLRGLWVRVEGADRVRRSEP